MHIELKNKFISRWKKYFDAELPITLYYTNEEGHAEPVKPGSIPRFIIGALSNVRKGKSMCFNIESVGCFGGEKFLGFTEKLDRTSNISSPVVSLVNWKVNATKNHRSLSWSG